MKHNSYSGCVIATFTNDPHCKVDAEETSNARESKNFKNL
jgi:hypothetical protein